MARCVGLLLVVAGASGSCRSDEDCSLNGECQGALCACDPGWTGPACGLLDLAPAPVVGAYGFSPNVSSWGASVLFRDGRYHMYASEMWNGCGIHSWQTNSHVVHATADTPSGPFAYADTALPPFSHCNHVLVANQTIYLFHQGRSGDGSAAGLENCSGADENPRETWPPAPAHRIHASDSPGGPWRAAWFGPDFDCENPSPLALENGSVALFCHGPGIRVAVAAAAGEPWSEPRVILAPGAAPKPDTVWEDPYAFLDKRGRWHLLSHVYPTNANSSRYNDVVAGHAFSRDGLAWTFSAVEPWTSAVEGDDGEVRDYATRERPFLLFDDAGDPVALYTAVTLPGHPKQSPEDYSFTHVQPVRGASGA